MTNSKSILISDRLTLHLNTNIIFIDFVGVKALPIGLYIHFPFCKSKCPYCDFYSLCGKNDLIDRYCDAVIDRLKAFSDIRFDTVYFGGGTPSVIGADKLSKIAEHITSDNPDITEFTVECNPSSITDGFFDILREAGVNRISMGMQSAVDRERKKLGRSASSDTVYNHIQGAKRAGIDNISLDLMLGIPYQTLDTLKTSVEFCSQVGASHISAYLLKIEEGTPFYSKKDTLALPDEDYCCDLYLEAVSQLKKHGFLQYEISNFAKDNRVSHHNLKYWNCDEYIGIGPSAHSFFNGKRFFCDRDINAFLNGASPVDDGDGGDFAEYAMLRLRLCEGITEVGTYERFSHSIPTIMYENAKHIPKNLICVKNDGISLTCEGFLLSNQIIGELLNNV
ncbi:MAG: radical SAM family heme chaperone HemW [Clostridia bacterium]|nr:radical SAM family heme chaperone HemW [Clostridia bacterium]